MWHAAELDDRDGHITDQVAALVTRAIERGELSVGSALPSERELARRLGVSRVSIVRALAALRARGVIATRHGSGSVVAPSDRLLDPVAPAVGSNLRRDACLDLRFGTTAAPHEVEEAAARVARSSLRTAMTGDGPPAGGSLALREALADHLTHEGLATLPTQLTLTSGAAAGLDLVLQSLGVGAGSAVTESPTYPTAVGCLRRHRLEVTGWPAGAAGWDLDQLGHLLRTKHRQVMYLQPDNHNPTGQSLPEAARPALIDLVRRHDVTLICDETLRPLWLRDAAQPPALSGHRGVISIGSLSKTVWGGLRVGWVRSSQATTRRLQAHPAATFLAPSALDELLAAEMLADLPSIVQRRRRILRDNLATLTDCLARVEGVTWQRPSGGMTAWVELTRDDSAAVVAAAAGLGLLVTAGAVFTPDGGDRRHLRVPFTSGPGQLAAAVRLLEQAIAAA